MPNNRGQNRWLSTETVANMLGVTDQTIRNMIEAGKFATVRRIGAGRQPPYQILHGCVVEYEQQAEASLR